MKAQHPILTLILSFLISCGTTSPAAAQSNTGTQRAGLTGNQLDFQRQALDAIKRAEREAAAMVPGRAWTWQLRAEQTREDLSVFGQTLDSLRDSEASFEASLTPEQRSKFAPQFQSIRELLLHILGDVESLDDELQKGYPARWHVARDVLDMQAEIRRLRKAHEQIARGNPIR